MSTKTDLIKKYEELSGRKGEFEVVEATDVNGLETIQVRNKVSGSLVAEVTKGNEDQLLEDPQGPTDVDHRDEQLTPMEMKNGEVVSGGENRNDVESEDAKKAEKAQAADEAKQKEEAKAKADKEAADKKAQAEEAARQKADAEKAAADAARQNGGN